MLIECGLCKLRNLRNLVPADTRCARTRLLPTGFSLRVSGIRKRGLLQHMQDEEIFDSIQEYLSSQPAADGAERPQVQSLDLHALQHAGGPRDGLSRPVLVGSTHPTPPHPPAARAPLHVHVEVV